MDEQPAAQEPWGDGQFWWCSSSLWCWVLPLLSAQAPGVEPLMRDGAGGAEARYVAARRRQTTAVEMGIILLARRRSRRAAEDMKIR